MENSELFPPCQIGYRRHWRAALTQAAPAPPTRGQRAQGEDSQRRADQDSSPSIEVTRVQQPRSRSGPSPTSSLTAEPAPSSTPVHEVKTPADDTGNAGSRPSETSGRPKGKKTKKKEKKRRQQSRSPSRKRRRRRRPSTPTEDAADDPPAVAVEVPIRHVSIVSPEPKPADPRLRAVQAADSAQEPTSPADGERDRSSVSELEYMFCCWGSARLLPPFQLCLSWCLLTWVPLRDVLVSSLADSPVSTAYRTAAFGSSGGWPPQTVAHASGTTAELAFLPDCSVESDPCHTSSRLYPSIPTRPALGSRRQWSASQSTDLYLMRPCLAAECLSAPLRLKHHPIPVPEPSVLGLRLFMEVQDSPEDAETSACIRRHPGTPVGVLVEIFRRHVPQSISYDETESLSVSVAEPVACGAEGSHSMPYNPPALDPPLSSTQQAAIIRRQRSGQVPRPSQAPHIKILTSIAGNKARRVTPPETMSSSSSSVRTTDALRPDDNDAQHMNHPLGWLPEDDAILDIGGRVEQSPEMSGTAHQLPESRLSKACAKLLIRAGLRCLHCYCLKDHCCCTRKSSILPWPRLISCITRKPLPMKDALIQAAALSLQWPAAGTQRRAYATCPELTTRSRLPLAVLSATHQPEVVHPPSWHPQTANSCLMQVNIHTFRLELTWGSRFHRRRTVLVLNASRRILWSHAFISLPPCPKSQLRSASLFDWLCAAISRAIPLLSPLMSSPQPLNPRNDHPPQN